MNLTMTENLETHCKIFNELVAEYTMGGERIKEGEKISYFLRSLLPKYDPVKNVFETTMTSM